MTDYARYRLHGDFDGQVTVLCTACGVDLNFGTNQMSEAVAIADDHEAASHAKGGT